MKRRDFLQCTAAASAMTAMSLASACRAEETPAANGKPKLHFTEEGKFKIAQFTDTHYRTDKTKDCVEAVRCIEEILDIEKPQLAVYTGDIVVAGDTRKGWDDILLPCIDRKIPYAVVFGNHDHENTKIPRRDIAAYIAEKPLSLTQLCPEEIYGATNYILEVYDGNKAANLLYCLDSNAYPPPSIPIVYDWFHEEQIAWYRKQSSEYTAKNGGKPIPALAFFHIPLCEFGEMIHHQAMLATEDRSEYKTGNILRGKRDNRMRGKTETKIVGQRFEIEAPSALNTGMFYAMWGQKDVMGIFVGHDHVNDYIGLHAEIALGFGRWTGSKTTYGSKFMTHGSRLFELTKDGGRTFKTWIRPRGGEVVYPVQVPNDLVKR